MLLIEENRTPEAFALIQTWAAQSPSLAEPRMELARLYAEFGNKEAATNTLADAVQLNPERCPAVGRLGQGPRGDGRLLAGPGQLPAFAGDQSRAGGRGGPRRRLADAPWPSSRLALPPPPGTTQPVVAGQPTPAVR